MMAPDSEPIALDPGSPRRRWVLVAGGLVAVLMIGGGALVVGRTLANDPGAETPTEPSAAVAEAEVERRTLAEHVELDGTLGYGDAAGLAYPGQGTLTWLPAAGAVIRQGEALIEVDGKPVPLLYGSRALWRELGADTEDGPDIEQLEANLVALGIVSADVLTVDQDWTSVTTNAVKTWQALIGVEATGTVAPSDVVFQPGAVRVAQVNGVVGGAAGSEGSSESSALTLTSTAQAVTIDLEASRQTLVAEDQAVHIVLPDGTETTGVLTSVGDVATADDSSEEEAAEGTDPTIEVVITLDDPDATGALDEAPVKVKVETTAAEDVPAVPVEALLALTAGGYGVEVRQADGVTRPVPVELGAEADGWVEVTGDVAEGDKVVVPLD